MAQHNKSLFLPDAKSSAGPGDFHDSCPPMLAQWSNLRAFRIFLGPTIPMAGEEEGAHMSTSNEMLFC